MYVSQNGMECFYLYKLLEGRYKIIISSKADLLWMIKYGKMYSCFCCIKLIIFIILFIQFKFINIKKTHTFSVKVNEYF